MTRKWLIIGFLLFVGPSPANGDETVFASVPADSNQVIMVEAELYNSYRARVSGWERRNGLWVEIIQAGPAVIGRGGLARAGEKREGDGKTPSGVFALKRVFGYEIDADTGLEYKQVSQEDKWIDDPDSPDYNQWITGPTMAKSFEKLLRDDNLYRLSIVVEYNTDPVIPGKGSAIFMHIWRGSDEPTAGCVAVSAQRLEEYLKWLDLTQQPYIAIN